MNKRTYHGNITPADMAGALVAAFNTGGTRCYQVMQDGKVIVQIATHQAARSGGKAALTVTLHKHEDGVLVAIGQLEWLGVAASLGKTAFTAIRNPWNLIHRLDDIAQDINSLRLEERAWEVLNQFARGVQATRTLSARLQTVSCPYCHTANKVGVSNCLACGGPLGEWQPIACPTCGNVLPPKTARCGNCNTVLAKSLPASS